MLAPLHIPPFFYVSLKYSLFSTAEPHVMHSSVSLKIAEGLKCSHLCSGIGSAILPWVGVSLSISLHSARHLRADSSVLSRCTISLREMEILRTHWRLHCFLGIPAPGQSAAYRCVVDIVLRTPVGYRSSLTVQCDHSLWCMKDIIRFPFKFQMAQIMHITSTFAICNFIALAAFFSGSGA